MLFTLDRRGRFAALSEQHYAVRWPFSVVLEG